MKNKAFTLAEVMVSLAIISIVSGVLFQIYIVAARVDRRAYDLDKANTIAAAAVEALKESPPLEQLKLLADPSQEYKQAAYLGYDWTSASAISYSFKVTTSVSLDTAVASTEQSYFNALMQEMDLSSTDSFYLKAENIAGEPSKAKVTLYNNYTSSAAAVIDNIAISSSITGGVLPVKLRYSGAVPKSIYIENSIRYNGSDVELALLILNARIPLSSLPPEQVAPTHAVEGLSSVAYVNAKSTDYKKFKVSVTVTRFEDSKDILKYDNYIYVTFD